MIGASVEDDNLCEIWKEHENYKGIYLISNYGRVKSIKSQKDVTNIIDRDGYLYVVLHNKRKRKRFMIHRLVYELFGNDFDPNNEVHHIDHNRSNNWIGNLCANSKREHLAHHLGEEYIEIDIYSTSPRQYLHTAFSVENASRYTNILPEIIREAIHGDGTHWACDNFSFVTF